MRDRSSWEVSRAQAVQQADRRIRWGAAAATAVVKSQNKLMCVQQTEKTPQTENVRLFISKCGFHNTKVT